MRSKSHMTGLRPPDSGLRIPASRVRPPASRFRLPASGLPLLLGTLALAATTACASMGRSVFATPTVELKDIRVSSIGLEVGAMEIVLNVTNPNDYRLDATRLTYNLFVDTNRVAFGEIRKTATLEAHKKNEVVVPVTFGIQELIRATQILSKTGGVDYHVAGEVTATTPGGSFTRPYKGDGHFDNLSLLRPR